MMLKRVLVVDDDPDEAQLLRLNFELDGFEVKCAADGLAGLEVAVRTLPDVILLDVMMPGIDGLEVARCLSAAPTTARIPIVMISAKDQAADVLAGDALASAYVTKPFDPLAVLDLVSGLLVRPSPQRRETARRR